MWELFYCLWLFWLQLDGNNMSKDTATSQAIDGNQNQRPAINNFASAFGGGSPASSGGSGFGGYELNTKSGTGSGSRSFQTGFNRLSLGSISEKKGNDLLIAGAIIAAAILLRSR